MNTDEREERRKKQRELRRKQVRNRMTMLCGIAAAAVIVIVLAVVNGGNNAAGMPADEMASAGIEQDSYAAANIGSASGTSGAANTGSASGTSGVANTSSASGTSGAADQGNTSGTPADPNSSNATDSVQPADQPSNFDQTGLYDPELCNVTPEELPAKVAETAAKIPECYTGELLPATTATYTDRSADFAVQPGVPCGADPVEGEKVVYLTLDDGPSANTITALNILDHYGIKCTFFVTGMNPDYYYLIKEAYDRGHTIGLHTYSHDYAYVYSSPENYYADLNDIGQVVSDQIGYVPCFIRFPGGAANYISHDYSEGIMTFLTQDVGNSGYQYFDWNASSGDGAETADPALLADAAVSYDYYDTIVLLSHDGVSKEPTMQALPFIIEYYLSKGYEFRPITRNAYTAHHTVEN